MNFDFSDDQKLLKEQVRKFLADKCPTKVVRRVLDGNETHADDVWKGLVDLGVPATGIPEAYGGLGLSPLEVCVVAEEIGHDRQGKVDPGCDAGTGDTIAVPDDPFRNGDRTQQGQLIDRGPVAGRLVAFQKPGRGEDERAGADRCDQLAGRRDAAQEIQCFLVVHQVDLPGSAGYADQVERMAIGEAHGRQDRHAAIGGNGLDGFPEKLNLRSRHAIEDLGRARQIELRQFREEDQADLHGGAPALSRPAP